MAFKITAGNVDDRKPVPDLVKNLWKMRGNFMVNSCQLWHLLFYFSVEYFPQRACQSIDS